MINVIMNRLINNEFVLIAEIGVNYYDIAKKLNVTPFEAAKIMIKSAKSVGIHAVKFQSYKADKLASVHADSYWDTAYETHRSQYELFCKYDKFSLKEYWALSQYCDEIGIEFCSTPFDFDAVDYLYDLMNVYKISSSDLTNIPFIEYIAQKNKPIILSTGASDEEEIHEAVLAVRRINDKPLVLMHCVLAYPTSYQEANLRKIRSLKNRFSDVYVGYSDHTKPDSSYNVLKTAFLLGANVIEKHFTLDKGIVGNDHYHAMDANDAKEIIKEVRVIKEIQGSGALKCLDCELEARRNARRSIVSAQYIECGKVITNEMLTFKRPGYGIPPKKINDVIGKTARKNILPDEIMTWEMLNV